jgi:hypothetical protein
VLCSDSVFFASAVKIHGTAGSSGIHKVRSQTGALMATVSDASIRLTLQNVAQFGDTDVFPYPIENHWFHDAEDQVLALLKQLDADFCEWLTSYPVASVKSLASVGYSGFRAGTQIDPVWNAYLLGLVIEIAPEIERARLGTNRVFSYRFKPSDQAPMLFDPDIGWRRFHEEALQLSANYQFILSTDISDFYPRVRHHRLENALKLATSKAEVARRIMAILEKLSGGASHGLPIGGNAARLLAELLLDRTDRLLVSRNVHFQRFVDDYLIFSNSVEKAQSDLVVLSQVLLDNEGLSLQRVKTRIMTVAEFRTWSPVAQPDAGTSEHEAITREFLQLRLRYDPYSPTANEDYENLKAELARFDIVSMLTRELRKSRVDEIVARQLIRSISLLDGSVRDDAVLSVIENMVTLYPVFPTVALVLRGIINDVPDKIRDAVFDTLRHLLSEASHVLLVPTNLAFALRIMAIDQSGETDVLLNQSYGRPGTDMMLKRDIIWAMVRRRAAYWLSDVLLRFQNLTSWEKRALLAASFVLGDEGRHWRDHNRAGLSSVDQAFLQWLGLKNNGRLWEVPL